MAKRDLAPAVVCFFLLADGARINIKSRIQSNLESGAQIGPEGETWEKNIKYVCMRKWEPPNVGLLGGWIFGFGSSEAKFVDQYCLVKYDEAALTANFQTAKDMSSCASSSGKMYVCPLQGDAPERRLRYSSKVPVPKACFRESDDIAAHKVIEAAFDEIECDEAMKLLDEQLLNHMLPKTTTTTTSTTTTTTTTTITTTSLEIIQDYFAKPDPEEIIECKALFTDMSLEFAWNFKGKAYKCCTSSAGKPTKLQDVLAEKPSVRYFGRGSGCGRMFGNTYHNGLSEHNGAPRSCPVPASLLKQITGDEYETIRAKLEA
jgi:hypothetical protein